jgi:hypothetical protein
VDNAGGGQDPNDGTKNGLDLIGINRFRLGRKVTKRLYHTTNEADAEKIVREQRLRDSKLLFEGRNGVWLSSEPIGPGDQKVQGFTYLYVDVELTEVELDQYDSGRAVEGIEGYRTFHIPSAVLDGKAVITYAGDIDELPGKLDGMSEEEKQAYFRGLDRSSGPVLDANHLQ